MIGVKQPILVPSVLDTSLPACFIKLAEIKDAHFG
jgi:hypothetical protein